jgi:hypothetical protein
MRSDSKRDLLSKSLLGPKSEGLRIDYDSWPTSWTLLILSSHSDAFQTLVSGATVLPTWLLYDSHDTARNNERRSLHGRFGIASLVSYENTIQDLIPSTTLQFSPSSQVTFPLLLSSTLNNNSL